MMKAFPSRNGHRDPKQVDGSNSGQLAQSPQVSICPPPLLGHHKMVTSLLDWSKVIIQPMKDGDGKRTFKLGPIVTMSYSPIPSLPRKQTPQQPTPGPSCTQWSEDLFRDKKPKFHLISTFDSSELTVPPFGEPSKTNEPLSPSSEPHEDVLTCEPEPKVAPTQSMEEPFGKSQLFLQPSPACPTPPHSIIIIDNMPVESPLPFLLPLVFPLPPLLPPRTPPPPPLIPIMRLARNLLTYK
ncbi:hypothetical protein O181_059533 [Austropuccinia psidii MF-1]|uniref:Uncharacterized protein n=1 Tax=Austropuccinia psidii MF-1 TaxID=1389203 RepID=A0A9Q3HWL3_9BASI|nr:hypothetical protein [Austropuccinia psidii MF-1]